MEQQENRTFIVQIKITSPPKELRFDSTIARSPETIEALRNARGRCGKDSIPFFEILDEHGSPMFSLSKCVNRLSNILDTIQNEFMISGGSKGWYVPESRMEALHQALKDRLDVERDALREQLADFYDEAFERFKAGLTDYLDSIGRSEHYQLYENQFPSLSEMIAKLNYEIIRCEPIVVTEGEGLQQQAAKQAIADLMSKLPTIQDEAYGKVADILTVLEKVKPGEISEVHESKLQSYCDRLDTLLGLWESSCGKGHEQLEAMSTEVRLLIVKARKESIAADLESLQLQWRSLYQLAGAGEGIEALHRWLYPELELEGAIAQLEASLESASEDEREKGDRRLKALQKRLDGVLALVNKDASFPVENLFRQMPVIDISTPAPNEIEDDKV